MPFNIFNHADIRSQSVLTKFFQLKFRNHQRLTKRYRKTSLRDHGKRDEMDLLCINNSFCFHLGRLTFKAGWGEDDECVNKWQHNYSAAVKRLILRHIGWMSDFFSLTSPKATVRPHLECWIQFWSWSMKIQSGRVAPIPKIIRRLVSLSHKKLPKEPGLFSWQRSTVKWENCCPKNTSREQIPRKEKNYLSERPVLTFV